MIRAALQAYLDQPDERTAPRSAFEPGADLAQRRNGERFASLPFDLADASIAEAAARLKIRHLISIDTDFEAYRDRAGRPPDLPRAAGAVPEYGCRPARPHGDER